MAVFLSGPQCVKSKGIPDGHMVPQCIAVYTEVSRAVGIPKSYFDDHKIGDSSRLETISHLADSSTSTGFGLCYRLEEADDHCGNRRHIKQPTPIYLMRV